MLQRLANLATTSARKLFGSQSSHSLSQVINMADQMTITILPALSDNYMYLIVDPKTKKAAVVDPVEPETVIKAVKEAGVELTQVLTTHHHWDHAGGNVNLAAKISNLTICGYDERVEGLNKKVNHADKLKIGDLLVNCLFTPCHTSGHICYHVIPPSGDANGAVFTGDTLFVAGCGKFFEGSAKQMYDALINTLGSLPDSTKVYCGHEYTLSNLLFASTVEPINEEIQKKLEWSKAKRTAKEPTVPSTIGEEKLFNPFMRVNQPSVQAHVKSNDPIKTMEELRNEKNSFVVPKI